MPGFADEIWEQPEALRNSLKTVGSSLNELAPVRDRLRNGDLSRVVMTGMGSSYSALYPAMIYLLNRGVTAFAVNAAELLHYHPSILDNRTLLIAVSQSGASVEIRRLVEDRPRPGAMIALNNDPDSSLAHAGDISIAMGAGAEVTVASKTYTCTLAAMHLIVRALTGDEIEPEVTRIEQLADGIQALLPNWSQTAEDLLTQFQGVRFYEFLGRGQSVASADTAALITKECAKVPTEALNAGQFRHGPMELTTPELGVFLFTGPEQTRHLSMGLANDLTTAGAKVVLIGEAGAPDIMHVPLPDTNDWIRPISEIIPLQLFAAELAKSHGLEVGKFLFGGKVTTKE